VQRVTFLFWPKELRTIAVAVLLVGCGGPVRSTDPRIHGLINQCFATVKESIFVSSRCQPIAGWPYCDTVKALNAEQRPLANYAQFPPTLQAFREEASYWSGQIRAQQEYFYGNHQDRLHIHGGIPAGTPLVIVQMDRWFNGENGTFWIARATIGAGDFQGRQVLLPWEGYDQRGWIRDEYDPQTKLRMAPDADPRYLRKCES
jgi:hypothetical protein